MLNKRSRTAKTPILSPDFILFASFFHDDFNLALVDSDHSLTEILRKLCDELCISKVCHSFYDSGSSLGRIARFEDTEPTNTPSAPSCIIRAASAGGSHTTGRKVYNRELAVIVNEFDQLERHRRFLAASKSSSSRMEVSFAISEFIFLICLTACTISPVPGSPFVRIMEAPSLIRRRASPRSLAPHTKGTFEISLVDMVHIISR